MDDLLVLDLWDVVIEVLRSPNKTKTPVKPGSGTQTPRQKNTRAIRSMSNRRNTETFHI